MITFVMSVYDKKARAFCTPFFCTHPDLGVRSLSQAVNDLKTPVGSHPEDFALYELGTYNDSNAEFAIHALPKQVAEAAQLKKPLTLVNDDQG